MVGNLWLDSGALCSGACPAVAPLVLASPGVHLTYSGPATVVTGSTMTFEATGWTNASPLLANLQVRLPPGLSAPTNVVPEGSYYAAGHMVDANMSIDPTASLRFDATVLAPAGADIVVTAWVLPSYFGSPVSMPITISVGSSSPPSPGIRRMAGADRFATSAAISRAAFGVPTPVAYIATGRNFPDALAAGPAARRQGGPVLLVEPSSIPASVRAELARITPAKIFVMGGRGAVGDAVFNALQAYTANNVERIEGSDRYRTAAQLIQRAFRGYSGRVYVASGANFPDALSGGAAAGAGLAPIVLATSTGLPAATVDAFSAMTPTEFVLLGGPGVLGSGVASDLASRYPGVPISRWHGQDRYATSAAIAGETSPNGSRLVFLARGSNYPDALSGVPAVALSAAPLLLTTGSCLPAAVHDRLLALDPDMLVLLGGDAVLPESAASVRCPG
jgi:putative cell wall-binding protein